MEGNELGAGVLDLLLLPHKRPESRLSHHSVGSENSHTIDLRFGLLLCWLRSSHNQILLHLLQGELWFSFLSHKSCFLPLNNNNMIISHLY